MIKQAPSAQVRFFVLFILLCNKIISLHAQNSEIGGLWKGKIYQDEGIYRSEYDIEMYLHDHIDSIVGQSRITVDDIYSEIRLVGRLSEEGIFYFQETVIISEKKHEDMEWCMKQGQLTFQNNKGEYRLKGTWNGKTPYQKCSPGTLVLTKFELRP